MEISLTRVIIFARDVEHLKNFYSQVFGLKITEEIQNEWVVLKAGSAEIALHKIGEEYVDDDSPKISNTKLVFHVKTGLHQLRDRLINDGVNMKEVKSFPGINSLFCDGEDPEGNVFQLEANT